MTRAAATLSLAFCLLLAGPVLRAEGANLNVTVHNLKNAEGQVIIAVFDSKENYLKKPVDERAVPITEELTGIAKFTDLTPGTYAVVVRDGRRERRSQVEVVAGNRMHVRLGIERGPRPWLWVGLGALLLGAAAAATAIAITREDVAPPIQDDVYGTIQTLSVR